MNIKISTIIIAIACVFSSSIKAKEKEINIELKEGYVKVIKSANKYQYAKIKPNTYTYLFDDDPLVATDGNMYAFFMTAIPEVFPKDKGYYGAKLRTQELNNGRKALAIDGNGYVYLAYISRMSDTDRRVGSILFWKEKI